MTQLRGTQPTLFADYGFTVEDEETYPALSRILKKLTPARIRKELEFTQSVSFSHETRDWIKRYQEVGSRGNFIFQLVYRMIQVVTLPIVAEPYLKVVQDLKLLIAMFIILLDDVADEVGDEVLLKELLRVPFEHQGLGRARLSRVQRRYLDFTVELWDKVALGVASGPRYQDFSELFCFDVTQLLNTMRYAQLLGRTPEMANKEEYWLYSSYSEEAMISFMLDLIYSRNFDVQKLGVLRSLGWQAQKLTRIGDCVSTWRREIASGDITSGVIVYALDQGVVSPVELGRLDPAEVIRRIKKSQVERELLKEWEQGYREFVALAQKDPQLATVEVLSIPDKLLIAHLSSKGFN